MNISHEYSTPNEYQIIADSLNALDTLVNERRYTVSVKVKHAVNALINTLQNTRLNEQHKKRFNEIYNIYVKISDTITLGQLVDDLEFDSEVDEKSNAWSTNPKQSLSENVLEENESPFESMNPPSKTSNTPSESSPLQISTTTQEGAEANQAEETDSKKESTPSPVPSPTQEEDDSKKESTPSPVPSPTQEANEIQSENGEDLTIDEINQLIKASEEKSSKK
jgi:hypothetical protein